MFPVKIWGTAWKVIKRETLQFQRKCSDLSIVKTHLEVPTFCDILIDVACKVRIKPLNIHKFHNINAFILQTDQKYDNSIEHYLDGNKVIVKGHPNLDPNTLCSIKAPVKANLNIAARNDVSVGYFHGDKIKIKTEGNVLIDRFQGDIIDVSTKGNIILNNFIQASNITATATEGSIKTGRLQSLNLKLKTINKGNIIVDSSYCSNSIFVVENGDFHLNNGHKHCKIFIVKGNLFLTGFDGQLSAVINSGSADIHLSRITGNSEINLKDSSNLLLKLTDSCQENTGFKINAQDVILPKILKCLVHRYDNSTILKPDIEPEYIVNLNCSNSKVVIENTSWEDMMKMKVKNKFL